MNLYEIKQTNKIINMHAGINKQIYEYIMYRIIIIIIIISKHITYIIIKIQIQKNETILKMKSNRFMLEVLSVGKLLQGEENYDGEKGGAKDKGNKDQPMSPTHRKKLFLTSLYQNQEKEDPMATLIETHRELNQLIDQLDSKVADKITKHSQEFIEAYRNEMRKIKQQLQELKSRTDKELNGGMQNKIQKLEKELILFKEDYYKLFQKIELKDSDLELTKLKLQQSQSERIHLQREVKRLLKNIKMKETEKSLTIERDRTNNVLSNHLRNPIIEESYQPSLQTPTTQRSFLAYQHHQHRSITKRRTTMSNLYPPLENSQKYRLIQQQQPKFSKDSIEIYEKLKKALIQLLQPLQSSSSISDKYLSSIDPIVKDFLAEVDKRYELIRQKYEEAIKNKQSSDLQQFFEQSVQMVRKQLLSQQQKRKKKFAKMIGGGLNDVRSNLMMTTIMQETPRSLMMDFQIFKKQDHLTILQHFLANKDVIKVLHEIMFPHQQKLINFKLRKKKNHNNPPLVETGVAETKKDLE